MRTVLGLTTVSMYDGMYAGDRWVNLLLSKVRDDRNAVRVVGGEGRGGGSYV